MADVEGIEINSLAYHQILNKLKVLHLMLIMVTSFQQKDEVLRERYLRLVQGRLGAK